METRKKYMANAWTSILMYTALFLAILLPFDLSHWGLALKASLILGLFAGFLNELIQQVRKLNGTGTPSITFDRTQTGVKEDPQAMAAAQAYLKAWKEGQGGKPVA